MRRGNQRIGKRHRVSEGTSRTRDSDREERGQRPREKQRGQRPRERMRRLDIREVCAKLVWRRMERGGGCGGSVGKFSEFLCSHDLEEEEGRSERVPRDRED
jgi:hypothetical protein